MASAAQAANTPILREMGLHPGLSHMVFLKTCCKSQFPHKYVYLFFAITNIGFGDDVCLDSGVGVWAHASTKPTTFHYRWTEHRMLFHSFCGQHVRNLAQRHNISTWNPNDEVKTYRTINFSDSKSPPFHQNSPSPWQQRSPLLGRGRHPPLRRREALPGLLKEERFAGMDHMSAMRLIDQAKAAGGRIVSFRSVIP